jgi:hypothetical protein
MTQLQHELKIRAPRGHIIQALTDRAALSRWHDATVTGNEHEWRLEYPNAITFRWQVTAADAEHVVWRCVDGPPQAIGKEAVFSYGDWPQAAGNYRKCNTLWAVLLHRLRQEAEQSAAAKR